MKDAIIAIILFLILGLSGIVKAEGKDVEQRLKDLEAQNVELQKQLAAAMMTAPDSADDDGVLRPQGLNDEDEQEPAQEQDIPVGEVQTLVDSNPGLFHCFVDRDPMLGGGHVIRWKVTHQYATQWGINSQPVVVYEPIGRAWRKVEVFHEDGPLTNVAGGKFFSVIPSGRFVYCPMPGRFDGNHKATYTFSGTAWPLDTNSIGRRKVYSGQHAGRTIQAQRMTKSLRPTRYTPVHFDKNEFE